MAYLAGGAHANARGDPGEAERLFTLSNAAASRAGWALLIARAHNDLGPHLVREGRFGGASRGRRSGDDPAGDGRRKVPGSCPGRPRRGAPRAWPFRRKHSTDFEASIALYDRIGSRWKAWTMVPARRRCTGCEVIPPWPAQRYEAGLRIAQSLGDEMAHSEILAGLALVMAQGGPGGCPRTGRPIDRRWPPRLPGDRAAGRSPACRPSWRSRRGRQCWPADLDADRPSSRREHRPSLAGALEVLAQVSGNPAERRARLEEAVTHSGGTWVRPTGSRRFQPVGHVSRDRRQRRRSGQPIEAERLFREIGARGPARGCGPRARGHGTSALAASCRRSSWWPSVAFG